MSSNIIELSDLAPRLARFDRLMGIDLGTKTIGLAVSDVGRQIASPLITIKRTRFQRDAAEMLAHVAKLGVAAFVIGLPLNMDGSHGPRVQATEAFVRSMDRLTPVPFAFWDERLSTAAVTRSLIDQDASRARRVEVTDRMAAAYILQGALDRLARIASDGSGQ